jgi:hypothetical protein
MAATPTNTTRHPYRIKDRYSLNKAGSTSTGKELEARPEKG